MVDDAVIIISEGAATTFCGMERIIHGIFLLTFDDEVKINGSLLRNPKATVQQLPGSASSVVRKITGQQEDLSLSLETKQKKREG